MKKNLLSLIALLLVLCMLSSTLIACTTTGSQGEGSDTGDDSSVTSSEESSKDDASEEETTKKDDNVGPIVEKNGDSAIIENANALANGVQAYFSNPARTKMTFENLNMSLEYAVSANDRQQVTALKNKDGHSYIEDTMDVFITMKNGATYYGSNSYVPATSNIYRFGYYFYEMRFEEQLFSSSVAFKDSKTVPHYKVHSANDIESYKVESKSLSVTNLAKGGDSYIIFGDSYLGIDVPASRYQFLKVTMTADEVTSTTGMLYIVAGTDTGSGLRFTSNQSASFNIINDGQSHEYLIPLTSIPGYQDRLRGIRLDISGAGASYQIHGLELLSADTEDAPSDLGIARIFNTYSDKLHQVLQVAAKAETNDIEAIGFTTSIPADTVAKLTIMNKDGSTVTDVASVSDWSSVVAIGFDIIDAGIFGYILPYDGKSGSFNVTLSDGIYTVIQSCTPENNTIIPSRGEFNNEKNYYDSVVSYNQNDFYMGNRIYTDTNHDFTEFLYEAIIETNPLGEKNFSVSSSSTGGIYTGYDALRGIYKFSVDGLPHFNNAYYNYPNKHYNVTFSVRGDKYDRSVYVMTTTTSGALECAVLLNEDKLLLPVPMEVGKNFSEAGGERNLFNINDETYSEAIFPMVLSSGEKLTYSILNIYQNWGKYPLKQLSWIQFVAPYYHLSTGVTETNCILPWYTTKNSKGLNTLPDFRTMSAPLWDNQPQHNSCGVHQWLIYNDADGKYYITSENTKDTIDSYGPTYADVRMDYISDDGKIKVTYVHSEMPQLDENRTYYEVTYEVLEDVKINDFRNNFQFYSVFPNNPTGNYRKIGYLDTNNQYQVTDSVAQYATDESGKTTVTFGEDQYFVLGDECPYFSFFDMDGAHTDHQQGYANVALLIYNYDLTIGGERSDAHFIIKNEQRKIKLSLDLGDVTLKKGDTFTINMILLPWGSQELDREYADPTDTNAVYYDTVIDESTGELYMDKNVRDVRENTLLDPIKVTAGANCEVIESVYVPKVLSTDGKSVEFTVSGGHNNIAVRAYGFKKLTVPKVEEFVDGKWVEYVLNSANDPDDNGYLHYYDGYMVHYDEYGYSYSFVFTMDNGAERKFRVTASEDFQGWPAEPTIDEKREDLLNVFVDHQEIGASVSSYWVSKTEVSEDDSYIRLFGTGDGALNHNGGKVNEGYLVGYQNNSATVETGSLLVLKYRLPTTNQRSTDKFEFFTSTVTAGAANSNRIEVSDIEADGEWHVVVVDLSKITANDFNKTEFVPADDGKYYAQLLRFDFFDKCMLETDYIDIAYFGLHNSLNEITDLIVVEEKNFVREYTFIDGSKTYIVNAGTGNMEDTSPPVLESFVHPDCNEYTLSDLKFASCVDGINGKTIAGGTNSKVLAENNINESPMTLALNGKTIASTATNNSALYDGSYLVISGWTVMDGGVSKYVFSVDGGKTWQNCVGYNIAAPSDVSAAHLSNAANRIGLKDDPANPFTSADDKTNGLYQGLNATNPKGIAADLSAYVGKKLHVIFAAVSAKDTSKLSPIVYVTNVKVVAEQEDSKPVHNEYVKEDSGYTASTLQYVYCIDRVIATKHGVHGTNITGAGTLAFNASPIASPDTTNNTTTPGSYLVFSGWAVVQGGGIEKYMWSADGGHTWYEAEGYVTTAPATANSGILNAANGKNLPYTFTSEDGTNGGFQSAADYAIVKGMAANLENYSGETVDVIFAAVPKADTSTLCVLLVATGVTVP